MMTNPSQEQGRENLEELARQAIETPKDLKALFPAYLQHRKEFYRKVSPQYTVIETEAYSHMSEEHKRLSNFIKGVLKDDSIEIKSKVALFKYLKEKKGQDFTSRGLFAQRKLRYYLDLANNRGLTNVAQVAQTADLWSFGNVGSKPEDYCYALFGDEELFYLEKRNYKPLVVKAKRDLVSLWTRFECSIHNYLCTISVESPDRYESEHRIWDTSDYRNAFRAFTSYANALARKRKLTKYEWNVLSLIQEDAIKKDLIGKNKDN